MRCTRFCWPSLRGLSPPPTLFHVLPAAGRSGRGGSESHGRALTGHRPGSRVYQEYQEEGAVAENPALAILDNLAGGILGAQAY